MQSYRGEPHYDWRRRLDRIDVQQLPAPDSSVSFEASIQTLLESATAQTRKVGEFTIPGPGKLVKAQRAARMGRDSANCETIKIKAKTTIEFAEAAKDADVPMKP